jgi:imidazolonepropionase-like amidohydrolase
MRIATLFCAGFAFIASPAAYADVKNPEYPVIIRAGKLVDVIGGTVRSGQCIFIEADKISDVAPCTEADFKTRLPGKAHIDWSAYTVLPGLMDLHTHLADAGQSADLALPLKTSPAATALIGAKNAHDTLMAGFTTVRDVGTYRGLTDVALKDAINMGRVPGPRMFVAGGYITKPGGGGELNGVTDNEKLPEDMRYGVSVGPGQAATNAEYFIEEGADFLKLIATGAVLAIGTEPGEPELSVEEMKAVVDIAAKRGVYVTAHAHGAQGIKNAIAAGVRSIEHASLIDDEALKLAKAEGTWLVMDIYNGDYIDDIGTKEGWPEEYLRKNRETTDVQRAGFAKAVKMGIKIAYGTDSGVYPHGVNGRQFKYMVRYGMTPMQAIQSATIRAAELLGKEHELGSIAPGHYADLVAVKADPLADITSLENIGYVMKGGELVR